MPIHPQCKPIADLKANVEEDRRAVWGDLEQAIRDHDFPEKQRLAKIAADLTRRIITLQGALEACELQYNGGGVGGGPQPLDATFRFQWEYNSTVAFCVATDLSGMDLVQLHFSGPRTDVTMDAAGPIDVGPFVYMVGPITFGQISFRISSSRGDGQFDKATGHMAIRTTLVIDDVVDRGLYSTLPLLLSTGHAEGYPMDSQGKLKMVGDGHLDSAGPMNGSPAKVTLTGQIRPIP